MTKYKLDAEILGKLQSADVYLFDVDDTLYPADNGLHVTIKQNICDHANSMAARDAGWRKLIDDSHKAGILEAPEARLVGLDRFFPLIIKKVFEDGGQLHLENYLRETYAVDYSPLQPNAKLVEAIRALRAQGKRVAFYTNGAASGDPENPLHVENVLEKLGFEPGEFSGVDIFDLNRARPHGRGKPTIDSVIDMVLELNIAVGKKIAFFDDVARNLVPFKYAMTTDYNPTVTVLCRTHAEPANQEKFKGPVKHDERRSVDLVVTDLGATLAAIAAGPNVVQHLSLPRALPEQTVKPNV